MFEGIFSEDETYNYEVLRALSHIPAGGADTAEVLATAQRIQAGDDERFGGGTHCQTGASHLRQRDFFDWLPTIGKR